MRWLAVGLLAWGLGVASGLGYVAVSGGWYEYRFMTTDEYRTALREQAGGGWEPVPGSQQVNWLRRPRFRIP